MHFRHHHEGTKRAGILLQVSGPGSNSLLNSPRSRSCGQPSAFPSTSKEPSRTPLTSSNFRSPSEIPTA